MTKFFSTNRKLCVDKVQFVVGIVFLFSSSFLLSYSLARVVRILVNFSQAAQNTVGQPVKQTGGLGKERNKNRK